MPMTILANNLLVVREECGRAGGGLGVLLSPTTCHQCCCFQKMTFIPTCVTYMRQVACPASTLACCCSAKAAIYA
jgi:hypothetical protein